MRFLSPFALTLAAVVLSGAAFVFWVLHEPTAFLADREAAWHAQIEAGDVVFQDLACGPRCDRIREVTHSRYSHVGIVVVEDGERVVWEAFHPVGPTPLVEWVSRGRERHVAVYRFVPSLRVQLPLIFEQIRKMQGLAYDGDYQWDDERIYCSELIAKAVSRAVGREVFTPRAVGPGGFGDKRALIERMSHGRLTEASPLVSPMDLIRSGTLVRIVDELESP
jgi:hypothetical protein